MESFVRQLEIRFRVSLASLLIVLGAVAILTITIDARQGQDSAATDQRVDAMLAKLTLEQHVTITLNRRSLAYWDVKSKDWKVDPGTFKVFVGDSSANLPLQADFKVK